jgi:hypothetical protein
MKYKSNNFERMAQRFVYPIFIGRLNNLQFSSTMTFMEYKGMYFCVFAAHALPNKDCRIESLGFLNTDGTFATFSESIKGYKVFKDYDIVVCNTLKPFELKNYFNIDDISSLLGFEKKIINWIGFSKKKAKNTYHKTQSTEEHIKKDLSVLDDGVLKWENAEYLIVQAKKETDNDINISGKFDNKKVTYKHEGYKKQ